MNAQPTRRNELQELLLTTGQEHHEAFVDTKGVDAVWALWYADHMFDRFNAILDTEASRSDLVYMLVGLSHEQPMVAPGAFWPRFCAQSLVQHYGAVT